MRWTALLFVTVLLLNGCATVIGTVTGPAAIVSCPVVAATNDDKPTLGHKALDVVAMIILTPVTALTGMVLGFVGGLKVDIEAIESFFDGAGYGPESVREMFGGATCGFSGSQLLK